MSHNNINKKIIELSGLSDNIMQRAKIDEKFTSIQSTLAKVHAGKGVLYGNYVKTRQEEPKAFALMSLFFDIKRKFLRFENIAKLIASGEQIDNDEITDTVADIAVYGVMGLMLMDSFTQGKDNEQ